MLSILLFLSLAFSVSNLEPVTSLVSQQDRELKNHHKAGVLWMTGLSGSGKSTLAKNLEKVLFEEGYQVYHLDGDNLRKTLCQDLGFSDKDRSENIKRAGYVSSFFKKAGFLVLASFISPYRADRENLKNLIGDDFHEVFIDAPLSTCQERDPKGFYKKALAGEIKNYTGVSSSYEEPFNPNLIVDTQQPIETCLEQLLSYIKTNFPREKA